MSQSTGPLSREEFEGVNGVVLPEETIGDMILTIFVDLHRDVVFVIIQGGFESIYFVDQIYYIENIDMVGVMLDAYMEGLDEITNLIEYGEDPMPAYEVVRNSLLTKARVKVSQRTN